MEVWNNQEYFSLVRNKKSMGSIMTMGVAESIVKEVTQTLIRCRMEGSIAMQIVHPMNIMSTALPARPISQPMKTNRHPIIPIEKITEDMVQNRALFSADRLWCHLKEYEKMYDVQTKKPRDYHCCLEEMIKLIAELKSAESGIV